MSDIASSCLVNMDGSFNDEEIDQQPCSLSGGRGGPSLVLDVYRKSFVRMDSHGSSPTQSHREGKDSMAFQINSNLIGWAAQVPAQRQLYQCTAASMGGEGGEMIEVGMSSSSNNVDMRTYFTEDNVQKSNMGDQLQAEQSRPSSSSSSLRSLSGESPEYCSSFLRNMANNSCVADHAIKDVTLKQAIQPAPSLVVQPHQTTSSVVSYTGVLNSRRLPTPETDDAAITRAMLAVLSSSTLVMAKESPQTSGGGGTQVAQQRRAYYGGRAFRPYLPVVDRKLGPQVNSCKPKMIKVLHSILRNIKNLRSAAEGAMQEPRAATSNQVHHMISERKRREKLNESFQALRSELPPGTRKDKASVLASTKDYLIHLKAQISDLEKKNQALELHLSPTDEVDEEYDASIERVRIETRKASELTSGSQQVIGRISVRAECDISDLAIFILRCLKEMGDVILESIAAKYISSARQQLEHCSSRRASLTLEIKTVEAGWDEDKFKKAIARAVDEAERATFQGP